jgi:general secretion pathway protein J
MQRSARLQPQQGFTLVELLIAVSVMALMAVLSWRGLDGMTQATTRLHQRADEVQSLQAGLAQWGADLDAMVTLPQAQALDWDGRALRLTRRLVAPADGLVVVAWSRRELSDGGQWLRWQSPALRTRGELQAAWAQAAQWAQNPGDADRALEVRVVPLSQWQIFFYRGDAWTNPLSSSGADGTGSSSPSNTGAGGLAASVAAAGANLAAAGVTPVPDGVRLVLTLPPGQAIAGTLTRDWIRPILGGGKS